MNENHITIFDEVKLNDMEISALESLLESIIVETDELHNYKNLIIEIIIKKIAQENKVKIENFKNRHSKDVYKIIQPYFKIADIKHWIAVLSKVGIKDRIKEILEHDPEIKKMNKKDLGKNIEENVIKKQSLSR